jgi:hypothetical protein
MTDRAADDLDIASFHARRSVRTAPCIVGVIESFDRPDAALSTIAMRRCDVWSATLEAAAIKDSYGNSRSQSNSWSRFEKKTRLAALLRLFDEQSRANWGRANDAPKQRQVCQHINIFAALHALLLALLEN